MQKIILLSFFALSTSIALDAQEMDRAFASARYSFTHLMDTTQPDNPVKENMILLIGKNMSSYASYDAIEFRKKRKANTARMNGGVAESVSGGSGRGDVAGSGSAINDLIDASNVYYKDQSASKISYTAIADWKLFSIEEKMPVIKWNITQETKEIKGMPCQKAIGDFKGRSYEAWFCSQLPFSNGPWKLGGLPGLILEVSDTKKEVMFLFTSFVTDDSIKTIIRVPENAVKTTPEKFKEYEAAVKKNRSVSGMGGIMKLEDIPENETIAGFDGKPMKRRRMNNPVEKDSSKK